MENVDVLPGCRGRRLALPLKKGLAYPASQAEANSTLGLRSDGAVTKRRQRRWCIRWRPVELLEQADVEHIMYTRADRELQADGHVVDELGDAIRPVEAGLQLARAGLRQRRSGTLA